MSYSTARFTKAPARARVLPMWRMTNAPARGRFVAPSTRSRAIRYRGRTVNLQTPAQIDGLGFSQEFVRKSVRAVGDAISRAGCCPCPARPRYVRYRRRPVDTSQMAGLGFSLKPPKRLRKAFRAVGRVFRSGVAIAAGSLIPGAGLLIGSRKAPRWLRAPKGVRPFVRKAAKVQLVAAGAIAAGLLAPALIPATAKLLPLAARFLPKGSTGGGTATSTSEPGYGGGGEGYGYSGGGEGGGGGGGSEPVMDQQEEADATKPAQAGGGALVIGGLALLAFMASRRRR